jgi:small multidrug resistance pump
MAMWWWLAGAIGAEVTATLSLRYAEGFTRLVPSILVVLGYGVAFYALIAVIGATVLHEPLSLVQVGGIALVIAGVLALDLGGSTQVP